MIPRSDYPLDRAGYHRWRTRLYEFHAGKAGSILAQVGYDAATITRVQDLLRKKNLKSDPEMQSLEDVACLVFLENDFADLARQHDAAKVIEILRKTWKKMSPRGQQAALEVPMADADRASWNRPSRRGHRSPRPQSVPATLAAKEPTHTAVSRPKNTVAARTPKTVSYAR